MINNERSLISHALKLYGVQYDDNIELKDYNIGIYIEVVDRNMWDSYISRVFNGVVYLTIYKSRNTASELDNNIRSFINHWVQYFNFNKTINRVAMRECLCNTFEIAILGDDNRWYYVLSGPRFWVDKWIIYNW